MHRLLLALILVTGLQCLMAQDKEYMYEIGAGIGTSWMYGDINRTRFVYDPSIAYDLQFRYNVNLRWAIAIDLSSSHIEGDSKDFNNVYPLNARWTFDRNYWQLGIRPEISFWNFGWGSDYREKHRIAPFLTAGLGFGWSTGETVMMGNKGGSIATQTNGKGCSTLSIPLGIGVKWKMAPRWDMQLTSIWARTFGDGIDGMTDPYSIGTKAPANTDWVSHLMLSITFSFKERCLQCHNQNE